MTSYSNLRTQRKQRTYRTFWRNGDTDILSLPHVTFHFTWGPRLRNLKKENPSDAELLQLADKVEAKDI
jgi:hypothetical protein